MHEGQRQDALSRSEGRRAECFAQGFNQSKSLAASGRALDRKERHG
jgi:hypothetical protein